jgi:hypothetical protein
MRLIVIFAISLILILNCSCRKNCDCDGDHGMYPHFNSDEDDWIPSLVTNTQVTFKNENDSLMTFLYKEIPADTFTNWMCESPFCCICPDQYTIHKGFNYCSSDTEKVFVFNLQKDKDLGFDIDFSILYDNSYTHLYFKNLIDSITINAITYYNVYVDSTNTYADSLKNVYYSKEYGLIMFETNSNKWIKKN